MRTGNKNKISEPEFSQKPGKRGIKIYSLSMLMLVATALVSTGLTTAFWIITKKSDYNNRISALKQDAILNQKVRQQREVESVLNYLEIISIDTVNQSIETLMNKALVYIESIRFGNDGYVFINTYDGRALVFDGHLVMEEKDISGMTDPGGIRIFEKELELAKFRDGGSFEYLFKKINDTIPVPKISFIKGFDRWRWIVGAGDYLDNINKEIEEIENRYRSSLNHSIMYGLIVFIVVIITLSLAGNRFAKSIHEQFSKLLLYIDGDPENFQEKDLLENFYIDEFRKIGNDILRINENIRNFGNIIEQSVNEIYIFRTDDLRFVHANLGAINNIGYNIRELKEMTPLNLKPEMDEARLKSILKPLEQKESDQVSFETIHVRKNGSIYPVEVYVSISQYLQDRVYVAFIYDISLRKSAEKNLRSSESRFRALFDNNHTIMFVIDPGTSKFIDVNPAAEKFYGYTREEFLGKMTIADINILEKEEIATLIENIKENRKGYFNFKHRLADGEIRDVEVYSGLLVYQDQELLLSIIHDATEKNKTFLALKDSRDKLESIFRVAPAGIGVVSDRLITEVNRRFCEITGYSKNELIGKESRIVYPSEEEFLRVGREKYEQIAEFGTGTVETQFRRKDGQLIDILLSSTPIDMNDFTKGVTFTALDITERNSAIKEIQENREHLEEIVKQRTTELEQSQDALLNLIDDMNQQAVQLDKSNKRLEVINRELETFTYSVSHDLKAPLRGIDGYSRLLLEGYRELLDEEGLVLIENIRNGSAQMNLLIEDLLAYSRMERRSFTNEEIGFGKFVESQLVNFTPVIEEKRVEFKFSFPENFSPVADREGLAMVFRNLIDNSLKFSATDRKCIIEIGGDEDENKWHIYIKDNGMGFDMKYHDRIFLIFHRLNLAEEYGGTGIGLAMVAKAMNRMNGSIYAESTPGEGACFHLELFKHNQ